jgi:hypothetical protein
MQGIEIYDMKMSMEMKVGFLKKLNFFCCVCAERTNALYLEERLNYYFLLFYTYSL